MSSRFIGSRVVGNGHEISYTGLSFTLCATSSHSMFSGNKAESFCEIAGSAITGPIGKECADLWPRIASAANAIV